MFCRRDITTYSILNALTVVSANNDVSVSHANGSCELVLLRISLRSSRPKLFRSMHINQDIKEQGPKGLFTEHNAQVV